MCSGLNCVVPENIHTPPWSVYLETPEGWGVGSKVQEIPKGRRGEWLDCVHIHVGHSCFKILLKLTSIVDLS